MTLSTYQDEYVDQVYKLCLLGATDKEIADFFEIRESTLNNWKKAYPDFYDAMKRGKTQADAEMAHKLYQRGVGYSHEAVKIFQYEGIPVIVPYTEHYPPDTQAAWRWLLNRQPEKWRDRSAPGNTTVVHLTDRMTDDELRERMIAIAQAMRAESITVEASPREIEGPKARPSRS